MVNHLAELYATKMVAEKIIDMDDKECYVYGLELLLSKIIVLSIILVIALITGTIIESVIFTFFYLFIRQYSGGYHCKTAEICMMVSVFIYLLFLTIIRLNVLINSFMIAISVISYFIILLYSPLADANKEIDDKEKKKYRIISFIIASVMMIMIVICFFTNTRGVFISVSCSLIADAILLLLAILKKGRKEYVDKNTGNAN